MVRYVIQEIVGFGYWSSIHNEFKGFAFAETHSNIIDAIRVAESLNKTVTIVKIYN